MKRVRIRMEEEQIRHVEQAAAARGMSVSALVEERLRLWLDGKLDLSPSAPSSRAD